MPPQDLTFFVYISPQKSLFQRYSMNLLSNYCQQTGKKSENGKSGPPMNPATTLQQIFFIIAIQPFMGVNEMRVKILPLLCRLGLVLRLGSV